MSRAFLFELFLGLGTENFLPLDDALNETETRIFFFLNCYIHREGTFQHDCLSIIATVSVDIKLTSFRDA